MIFFTLFLMFVLLWVLAAGMLGMVLKMVKAFFRFLLRTPTRVRVATGILLLLLFLCIFHTAHAEDAFEWGQTIKATKGRAHLSPEPSIEPGVSRAKVDYLWQWIVDSGFSCPEVSLVATTPIIQVACGNSHGVRLYVILDDGTVVGG